MAYADATDANRWLDGTTISVSSGDMALEEDSAERIIRGFLAGKVNSVELNSWVDPTSTPEMIREIAGQFVAAFRYRRLYSENVTEASDITYGQRMYDEAMAKLLGIASGEIQLADIPSPSLMNSDSELTGAHFYPNDLTQGTTQDRRFSWDNEF
jgi:hypothetical protein